MKIPDEPSRVHRVSSRRRSRQTEVSHTVKEVPQWWWEQDHSTLITCYSGESGSCWTMHPNSRALDPCTSPMTMSSTCLSRQMAVWTAASYINCPLCHAASDGHDCIIIKLLDTDIPGLACVDSYRIAAWLLLTQEPCRNRSPLMLLQLARPCVRLPGIQAIMGSDSTSVVGKGKNMYSDWWCQL